jgi:hypothetical protein
MSPTMFGQGIGRRWRSCWDRVESPNGSMLGIEYQTAAQAVRVCKAFESGRRLPLLGFYHHQEVAGRDDKVELLG